MKIKRRRNVRKLKWNNIHPQTKKQFALFKVSSAQDRILKSRADFILNQVEERIRLATTVEEIGLAINFGKRNLTKKMMRAYADESLKRGGWDLYNDTKEALARMFGEDWVKRQLNITELVKKKKTK